MHGDKSNVINRNPGTGAASYPHLLKQTSKKMRGFCTCLAAMMMSTLTDTKQGQTAHLLTIPNAAYADSLHQLSHVREKAELGGTGLRAVPPQFRLIIVLCYDG